MSSYWAYCLGKCNANCLRNLLFILAKKNEYLVDNPTTKTFYFKINNGEEKNHYFWSVCKSRP